MFNLYSLLVDIPSYSFAYNFLNVGKAAVRIHTIKSSLTKPELSTSSERLQTDMFQLGGWAVPLNASQRSEMLLACPGLLNFVSLSLDQAIPVRVRLTSFSSPLDLSL